MIKFMKREPEKGLAHYQGPQGREKPKNDCATEKNTRRDADRSCSSSPENEDIVPRKPGALSTIKAYRPSIAQVNNQNAEKKVHRKDQHQVDALDMQLEPGTSSPHGRRIHRRGVKYSCPSDTTGVESE